MSLGPADAGRAGRSRPCWHPGQSPFLCQWVDWTPPGSGRHPRPLVQVLALGFQNAEEAGGRAARAKPFLVSFHALGKSTQAPHTLRLLQSKIQARSCSLKCSPVRDSLRGQTSSGPGSPLTQPGAWVLGLCRTLPGPSVVQLPGGLWKE